MINFLGCQSDLYQKYQYRRTKNVRKIVDMMTELVPSSGSA